MKITSSLKVLTFIITLLICSCKKSGGPTNPPPKEDSLGLGWVKKNDIFNGAGANTGGDIFFIDQNLGYACNSNSSMITKSVDGGNSWQLLTSNKNTPNIAMTPDGKLFLTNDDYDSLYKSVDGGGSFISTYTYGAKPNDIYFRDNSTGLCTTKTALLLTSDGGNSWSNIGNIPNIDSAAGNKAAVTMHNNNAWVVYNKYVYYSNDNFITWKLDSVPPIAPSLMLSTISAPSNNTIYASSYSGYLFKSTDGGATFNFVNKLANVFISNYGADVHFITDNIGYLGLGSRIYKTIDGGNNWSVVVSLATTDIVEIHFIDEQHGWAICYDGSILKFN